MYDGLIASEKSLKTKFWTIHLCFRSAILFCGKSDFSLLANRSVVHFDTFLLLKSSP